MAAKTTSRDTPPAVEPSSAKSGVVETRIDAAHQFSVVSAYDPLDESDDGALSAKQPAGIDFAELKNHARQIAVQLRARKEDLDRREAEVARHLAEHDKEVRQLRLWHEDQRSTFTERDERLQRREQTIERQIEWLIQYGDAHDPRPLPEDMAGVVTDPKLIAVGEVLRRWHAERSAMNTSRETIQQQRLALDEERRRLEQEITSQREQAMQSVRAALEQIEVRRSTLDRREEVLRADEQEWGLRRAEPSDEQLACAALLDKRERDITLREQRFEKERVRIETIAAGLDNERAEIAQQRASIFTDVTAEQRACALLREQLDLERAALVKEREELELRRIAAKEITLEELKSEREQARQQMLTERGELKVELEREYELFLQQTQLERERLDEAFQLEQARVREELAIERERVEQQARIDRQRLVDEQRRLDADLQAKRKLVEQEAAELDHRRLALQNEHAEVLRLHQETLEQRLATEELASQLSDELSVAEVNVMLSKTRQRIATHFRLEMAELDRRYAELDALHESLEQQLELLAKQSDDFDHWTRARQDELDSQASSLLEREQQFEAQAAEVRQTLDRAQCERMELEQETRRLQGELRVAKLRTGDTTPQ